MKKMLAVLLSVTVLITSCFCLIFTQADGEKNYAKAENWGMYNYNHKSYPGQLDDTSTQKWGYEDSTTIKYKDKDTLRFKDGITSKVAATSLANLTPGKSYTLSFKYYVPSGNKASSAGYIFNAGVYKEYAPIEAGGKITSKSFMLADQQPVAEATGKDKDGNPVWEDMTFTFTAPEETAYLAIAVMYAWQEGDEYAVLYFSDFKVEEYIKPKNYALAENWGMYNFNHTAYPGQLDDTSVQKWGYEDSTTILYEEMDTLRFKDGITSKVAATSLANLTPGKSYSLSFKYYVPSGNKASSAGYIFNAGVYKENAPIEAGGKITSKSFMLADQQPVAEATGKDADGNPVWKDMTFTFTAPEETAYLAIAVMYAWQEGDEYAVLYFSDFKVEEYIKPKNYALAENWGMYNFNHTAYPGQLDDTSVQKWGYEDSTTIKYEEMDTLRFKDGITSKVAATSLANLTPGKNYSLSFKYYVPSGNKASSAGYIFNAGVYKENAPIEAGGKITSKSFMLADQQPVTEATGKDADGNPVWKDMTFTFTAPEETAYLAIAVMYAWQEGDEYAVLYFSDFKVEEYKDTKKYAKAENWGMYNFNHTAYPGQLDDTSVQKWGYEDSTTIKYEEMDTLRFNDGITGKVAATSLADLTPGQSYTLSFKYYVPSGNKASSAGYIFNAGVYKENAPIEAGGKITSKSFMLADQQPVVEATGKDADGNPIWQEMSFGFTAPEETAYLAIAVSYGWQEGDEYAVLYFSDFKVEEGKADKNYIDINAWKMYKAGHNAYPPQIDNTSTQNWAISLSDTVKCAGKNSLVFGSGNNVSNVAAKLDDIEEGKMYEVKFKYYVPSGNQAGTGGYIMRAGIYRHGTVVENGNITEKANFLSAQTDIVNATGKDSSGQPVWEELSIYFTAGAEDAYLGLSFKYGQNAAGEDYANIYIADMKVAEADPEKDFCATTETELFYCEDAFNLLNADEYADLKAGKTGVYTIKVKNNATYTFAAKVSGKGSIALSLNGKTPMSADVSGVPSGKIESSEEGAKKAMDFFSGAHSKIYLIVENTEDFKVEEIMFFAAKSANEASTAMGYAENPNKVYTSPKIYEFKTK